MTVDFHGKWSHEAPLGIIHLYGLWRNVRGASATYRLPSGSARPAFTGPRLLIPVRFHESEESHDLMTKSKLSGTTEIDIFETLENAKASIE